ncbi:MAG: hypothetical protein CFH06_00620 [Alphaproteobacteria bacterium MarineAlpha3_Bin5]|nr:hypothetical protein [Magnetovibrio sp.]PPR78871.1 MAG: hypothetical protein CFH06_00620 [Alphaproteobacteria bacterium MarineAlpha3_Bin5]|tara:strand:+ start:471 stop:896 length:426 start_codon:yes stop_codon:yes gene_type:complete
MKFSRNAVFLLVLLNSTLAIAENLTVKVVGISKAVGNVHIALYNDSSHFPKREGMLEKAIVPVRNQTVTWVFRNLSEGHYAVATYHDANGDHEFNQGFLGLPLEDYGFSMDATGFLSAPDFSDAAFTISGLDRTIIIDLDP